MEPPSSAWREALRDEQSKVLRTVRPLSPKEIVLGQFSGYRQRTDEALGIGVRTLDLKLKKWKELNLVAQTL